MVTLCRLYVHSIFCIVKCVYGTVCIVVARVIDRICSAYSKVQARVTRDLEGRRRPRVYGVIPTVGPASLARVPLFIVPLFIILLFIVPYL